jgi:hypothetical protein
METPSGWEAVIGNEFFPGDRNLRVTLQVAGRGILASGQYLDRTTAYQILGEVEQPFARARWNAQMEFAVGLDARDLYFHPEMAYEGWASNSVYIGAHFFEGEAGTPGGFHQDHDLVVVGWRNQF